MDAFLKMGERRERGTGGDKSGDLRVGEGDGGISVAKLFGVGDGLAFDNEVGA